ncbi:hypothetical protein PO909_000085 [Leuciscus waleckii]
MGTRCGCANTGKRILAVAPRLAVRQCIRAERALGQGIKQVAVGQVVGGKQIYLCIPELIPNQLNRLGMESPFSRERPKPRQLVGRTVQVSRDINGSKRPQMLLTPYKEVAGELRHTAGSQTTLSVDVRYCRGIV